MVGVVKNKLKYDGNTGNWYCKSNYSDEVTLDNLAEHLAAGGSNSYRSMAGICDCSPATIGRWLDPKSKQYKPKLHAVYKHYQGVLALKADKEHHDFATGKLEGGDTRSINRRWDRYTNGFSVSFKPSDSYAHKVQCILKDLENGNIDGAEAREWIKTFANSDTEAALEKINEMLKEK